MLKIKRLYIIGAGASFPYGLPTLNTLTWDLSQFLEEEESKIIHEAIYETFNVHLNRSDDSPNFEELLNRLDARALSYLPKDSIDILSSARSQTAEIALNGLRKFIIHKCKIAEGIDGPYDRLVKSLTEEDAIVSFNWDVLIELSFRRIGRKFDYLQTDDKEGSTIFLKPHGSINWFALLDRELLAVDLKSNWDVLGHNLSYYMMFLKDPLASRDVGDSSPFVASALSRVPAIVPPVASKMLSVGGVPRDGFVGGGHEKLMKEIWRLFYEIVQGSTEIVIIGYSLSGTDAASIEVLKRCVKDGNGCMKKRVMIVDKNPEVLERYKYLVHPGANLVCDDFNDFNPEAI
jgi:hypothetical protein